MPVYVYECDKKGHQFEVAQKMTDDPIKKCEVCGGKVHRLLFAPAIHFKGSGFHNTDYGTKSRPKDGGPADGAPKNDAGSADSGVKSDSAATKTDAPAKTNDATPKAKAATVADRKRRGVGP